jgi:tRNA modification GTPase
MGENFSRHNAAEPRVRPGAARGAEISGSVSTRVAGETIAAISTAAGEGAIALVRLSGEDAIGVADRIFRSHERPSDLPSHTQRLGEIVDDERVIDEVMISVHRAPASYTGEDVVEISCHGGTLVTARVLEASLRAGARAARPGEFTERAFLNGKMDLTQAEAVIDVIRARTDLALRAAHEQLDGRLGRELNAIRLELVNLLAHLEASIDFADEDVAPDEGEKLCARLQTIRQQIVALVATAEEGRMLREGARVVIAGPTNAGKSSLLNRLLGHDRAIVSEIPGTTRDTIEEVVNLRGIPVLLLDTAGLRESADEIERAGVARAEQSLVRADLVLHVFDRSAPKPPNAELPVNGVPVIVLLNKGDLPEHHDWAGSDGLRVCALNDDGAQAVAEAIVAQIGAKRVGAENNVAINVRHRDCLQRALDACDRADDTLQQGLAPEYVALDLRAAIAAVAEILGAVDNEQVLDAVFSQFCIGK